MAFAKLIAFDRPLGGAVWPGQVPVRTLTEAEVAAKCDAAYHAGVDAAQRAANQQMVDLRSEMAELSAGVLQRMAAMEPTLLGQLQEALPSLALEIARRLLADFELPPEVVERLWRTSLEQLYPERANLELTLCPREAHRLEELNPEWRSRYPGLKIVADPTLGAGDTLVRSRFGLTDSRRQTKLAALQQALAGS